MFVQKENHTRVRQVSCSLFSLHIHFAGLTMYDGTMHMFNFFSFTSAKDMHSLFFIKYLDISKKLQDVLF